jgi:hypothetical protein
VTMSVQEVVVVAVLAPLVALAAGRLAVQHRGLVLRQPRPYPSHTVHRTGLRHRQQHRPVWTTPVILEAVGSGRRVRGLVRAAVAASPDYAEYLKKTTRTMPIFVLTPFDA